MHRQELLNQFFESLSNDSNVEKIKITFKNGEALEITFDYDDEDKNYNYINNDDNVDDNEDDDELEDETVVDVDKDDFDGYIDDDDEDDDESSYN